MHSFLSMITVAVSRRWLSALWRPAVLMLWLASSQSPAQTLTQRWAKRANEPPLNYRYDEGRAVKVGPDGNVVMTGNSYYSSGFTDILTVKYAASTGNVIWQRRSHTATDKNDRVNGLALDAAGNVIVVGYRQGAYPDPSSLYIAKYAADKGSVTWEKVFNRDSSFSSVGVDAEGNVLATGTVRLNSSSPIESDIITYKFAAATGDILWKHQFSGVKPTSTTADLAKFLTVDAGGNVIVTGYGTRTQYEDVVILKINGTNGSLLWSKYYWESGWDGSSGQSVVTDSNGDVFMACGTRMGYNGLRVVKYRGADGTPFWVNTHNGPQRDEPSGLTLDSQGNAVVTGYSRSATGTINDDIFTRKIQGTNGQTLWTRTFESGSNREDRGLAVAVDSSDNPVVAGYGRYSVNADSDFTILKYAAGDGATLIQQRVNASVSRDEPVDQLALAVGPGHITVTGVNYTSTTTEEDVYTFRLNDPTKPAATTLAATSIRGVSATLNSTVNPNGSATQVRFEYGRSESNLNQATSNQAAGNDFATVSIKADVTRLSAGTTYFYRVRAESNGLVRYGEVRTFTTVSDNANLASLALGSGSLAPSFDKTITSYIATVPFSSSDVTVVPVIDHPNATVKVNGISVTSGTASSPVSLPVGNTVVSTVVTAEDGVTTKTYMISLTRLPLEFVFNSAADVPVTANGFAAGGHPANVVLNHAPAPGTVLTMVNNTGLGWIVGAFANLAQGQRVTLDHGGKSYEFVANYHGGTGNDLVLQWAATDLFAWGGNGFGQVGDDSTTNRLVPTPVNATGLLAGKTVLAVSGGYLHSVALCADGTLAAWGYNIHGQLGNDGNAAASVPVAVEQTGALAGKSVIAIAAGPFHNLALCADGTVAAWGYNNHGQLGDGSKVTRRAPVLVPPVGALAGKQVVAVAAGCYHSFALGADGTVAAWGYNDEGELGSGTTTGSLVPVAVNHSGALAGKRVAALAAGQYHTLALCTDGTLVSWGYNRSGQLGNNSTVAAGSPVAIGSQGVLAGRSVVAIAAGGDHSLARCADGALTAWGSNSHGQLGTVGISHSTTPLVVDLPGFAPGDIAAISAGRNHNLLRLADGSLLGWGDNANGQLGDGTTTSRATPAPVAGVGPAAMFADSGAAAQHHLAVVAKNANQRLAQLENAAGFGNAGGDGIADLINYAFQLDPQRPAAEQLPQGRLLAGEYVVAFTQPAGISDIDYGAEWSPTLEAGTWQEVPDTGSGNDHRFAIPVAGAPQGFMRLKVTVR